MDVIVYGTGNYGQKFMQQCGKEHNVLFWVDGNKDKQGDVLFDREIKSPDVLKEYLNVGVVIAICNDLDIRLRLFEMGCKSIWKFLPDTGIVSLDGVLENNYIKTQPRYWGKTHSLLDMDAPYSCTSQLCNQQFFDMPFFHYWAKKFMPNFFDHLRLNSFMKTTDKTYKQPIIYHRKLWEWVYISQALYERGMLSPEKKGLAFGVGEECTPDLYASYGCKILATDLGADQAMAQGWMKEGQNAGGNIRKLNKYKFCNESDFDKRVSYRDVNMNEIPEDIRDYDFCWSACALEHLGGLQNGLDFIRNSLNTIKSRGIAVHTTEFNLSSNDDTLVTEGLSIYRRCDIEKIAEQLEAEGHYIYPIDWHKGDGVVDNFVDFPPYGKKDMHLRLRLSEYACTSIGIIIKKK